MADTEKKYMYYKRRPEVRISGVAQVIHDQLQNIADNTGISLSDFLKPKLRDIVDSYPEHMKKPKTNY